MYSDSVCFDDFHQNDRHRFPKDGMLNVWLAALGREGFVPSSSAVVCTRHFAEEHIIRGSKNFLNLISKFHSYVGYREYIGPMVLDRSLMIG